MEEKIKLKIIENIEDQLHPFSKNESRYRCEAYVDYRDELGDADIMEILESEFPRDALHEKLWEWYIEQYDEEIESIFRYARTDIEDMLGLEEEGLDERFIEEIKDFICKNVYFETPDKHFLKQEHYCLITTDFGDGNYDFTHNSLYPSWIGAQAYDYDGKLKIHETSGILWLARQQGYTKTDLKEALLRGDMSNPNGFLESLRVECANTTNYMNTLTFLVTMTLDELIKINRLIKYRDSKGVRYDTRKYDNCGYIIISKDADCGNFNPWQGGGSVLEIQLDKDVKLPVKYIRTAMPDVKPGEYGYSADEVYGLCKSCYRARVKDIHCSKKIRKELGI